LCAGLSSYRKNTPGKDVAPLKIWRVAAFFLWFGARMLRSVRERFSPSLAELTAQLEALRIELTKSLSFVQSRRDHAARYREDALASDWLGVAEQKRDAIRKKITALEKRIEKLERK
jgi:hypothetical protein